LHHHLEQSRLIFVPFPSYLHSWFHRHQRTPRSVSLKATRSKPASSSGFTRATDVFRLERRTLPASESHEFESALSAGVSGRIMYALLVPCCPLMCAATLLLDISCSAIFSTASTSFSRSPSGSAAILLSSLSCSLSFPSCSAYAILSPTLAPVARPAYFLPAAPLFNLQLTPGLQHRGKLERSPASRSPHQYPQLPALNCQ
jgi:hypothetical protein